MAWAWVVSKAELTPNMRHKLLFLCRPRRAAVAVWAFYARHWHVHELFVGLPFIVLLSTFMRNSSATFEATSTVGYRETVENEEARPTARDRHSNRGNQRLAAWQLSSGATTNLRSSGASSPPLLLLFVVHLTW
jgi:hypothetical protein